MKKALSLLLAALLLCTLAACGSRDVTPGTSASHEPPQIAELYNEDFDYTDGVGNSGHFTYRVPQIEADTPGAEAINKTIAEEYGPIVDGVLESVSEKVSMSCLYIAWETYQYDNILSLVVSCGWDADINSYNVYLYDTANGRQLTTADLLKALDMGETTFLEAVRKAAADTFDNQYEGISGSDFDEFLTERRDCTLSDENINMDAPAYVDVAGKLHVVLPIGSIAGADSYERMLTLDTVNE